MVLLAGPRQCGKTTLARSLSESFANKLHFNWDIATDKRRLIENPRFFEELFRRDSSRPLVILDDIHKHKDWKNYLKGICDRFHLTFSLSPWTPQITRSIHRERKTYLFDYAGIENPAAKFENMVALELFRAVSNWNDMGWGNFGLHNIRTKEGREVDFLVSQNRKPLFLVETTTSDNTPSPNLIRFQKALGVPAVQLLDRGKGFKKTAPAAFWLPRLPGALFPR